MKSVLPKKVLWILFVLFFGITIFLLGILMQAEDITQNLKVLLSGETLYSEVEYLQDSGRWSFEEFSVYFSDIAREKGGTYAFEVLKIASIPPDIDMHLLAHVVGDILFAQEGLTGIKVCTHDFRNACSHSIVIGLFFEQGEDALTQISEACYQAPGGSGAYTMCFHGLGHGMLAYASYNLKKAVELCRRTGTSQYGHEEASQCISGAIMEIISGVHDKELWASERPKYFKESDPLYPCSADFIPSNARYLCYLYLTPHLFEVAGINTWTPTTKAFPFCEGISIQDTSSRDACYGGFGKEFIGWALGRDIRTSSVQNITEEQLELVYDSCLLAGSNEGSLSCIKGAMSSLFWGGENDRSVAISFCSFMPDSYYQNACFEHLIGAVDYYIKNDGYKIEFCGEIPDTYQEECHKKLLE